MYINLGDFLGALLLVGRLNKSCQMFSTKDFDFFFKQGGFISGDTVVNVMQTTCIHTLHDQVNNSALVRDCIHLHCMHIQLQFSNV